MATNTSPDNLLKPQVTDQIAPLETVLGNMMDSVQTALTNRNKNGFIRYTTKAAMTAVPGTDINQHATVYADPTTTNNGDYVWDGASWRSGAGGGLVLIRPTSIVGGAIGGVGRVDFTGASLVSLNGVFTTAYDNYRVIITIRSRTGTGSVLRGRLRAAGVDAAGGSDYSGSIIQYDTSASGGQTGAVSYAQFDNVTSLGGTFAQVDISDPALAQATIFVSSWSKRKDAANTASGLNTSAHNPQTAFDGLSIFPDNGTITGTIHVYGYSN